MQMGRIVRAGVVAGFAVSLSGCFTSGVYRTARTLEKGEGDLGFSFAVTKIKQESTASSGGSSATTEGEATLPTIIPEINYHLGITDNLEVGGRVAPASLFVELDAKYRFIGAPGEKLHVAVGGAVGYQSAVFIDGTSVSVPLILTYDVTDNFAVNVAGFGRMLFLSDSVDGDNDIDVGFTGNTMAFGGHLGLELRGETFYIMPAFEVSKWLADTESETGGVKTTTEIDTTIMQGTINFGFVFGREKKQLDRIENKIDKMDGKLDKALDK